MTQLTQDTVTKIPDFGCLQQQTCMSHEDSVNCKVRVESACRFSSVKALFPGSYKAAFSGCLHTVQDWGRSPHPFLNTIPSTGLIFWDSLSLIASQGPHFNVNTITLEVWPQHMILGEHKHSVHSKEVWVQAEQDGHSERQEQHQQRSRSVKWHAGCSQLWAVWCYQSLQTLPPPPHTESFLQTKKLHVGTQQIKQDTIRGCRDTSPERADRARLTRPKTPQEVKWGGWWWWRQALE